MHKILPIALYTMRIAGVAAVALGLAFWSGQLRSLLPIHMALGLAMVLALWVMSVVALMRGGFQSRAVVLFILGLAILALGVAQTGLLPGPQHWVVRAVHLLLGVIAIRQGEVLARRLRARAGQTGAQKPEGERLAAQ
jgi:hypothetical protein